MGEGPWEGLSVGSRDRVTLLQEMLVNILLGGEVKRNGLLDPTYPGVTWSALEALGHVKLNPQV